MKHAPFFRTTAIALGLLIALAGTGSAQITLSAGASPAAKSAAAGAAAFNYAYDETPMDRSNRERLTSYADMLDKVTPAVVSIETKLESSRLPQPTFRGFRQYQQNNQGGDNGGAAAPSRIEAYAVGSGCILSSDGYILTNHHVATAETDEKPADVIVVKLPDGREFEAKFIGSDKNTDIALLKIDAKDLPTLKMADSDKLRVGDIVFAVGDPMDVGLTVTQGIVSAIGRSDLELLGKTGYEDFIQTDASINQGNSGGPLVDANGRLVGLNSAILSTGRNGGSVGIGFSIPSALARHVMNGLASSGKVRRGFLGVNIQDLDSDLAKAWSIGNTHGAVISNVKKSPQVNNGLVHRGDIVLKIDNESVDSADKLRFLISRTDPGSTVTLNVLREGKAQDVKVTLGENTLQQETPDPSETGSGDNAPGYGPGYGFGPGGGGGGFGRRNRGGADIIVQSGPLEGVNLQALTPALRQQYVNDEDKDNVSGLAVAAIAGNSPYSPYTNDGNGILPGMVIVEVNNRTVTSVADMGRLLKPGAVNVFLIYSKNGGGGYAYIPITMPKAQ